MDKQLPNGSQSNSEYNLPQRRMYIPDRSYASQPSGKRSSEPLSQKIQPTSPQIIKRSTDFDSHRAVDAAKTTLDTPTMTPRYRYDYSNEEVEFDYLKSIGDDPEAETVHVNHPTQPEPPPPPPKPENNIDGINHNPKKVNLDFDQWKDKDKFNQQTEMFDQLVNQWAEFQKWRYRNHQKATTNEFKVEEDERPLPTNGPQQISPDYDFPEEFEQAVMQRELLELQHNRPPDQIPVHTEELREELPSFGAEFDFNNIASPPTLPSEQPPAETESIQHEEPKNPLPKPVWAVELPDELRQEPEHINQRDDVNDLHITEQAPVEVSNPPVQSEQQFTFDQELYESTATQDPVQYFEEQLSTTEPLSKEEPLLAQDEVHPDSTPTDLDIEKLFKESAENHRKKSRKKLNLKLSLPKTISAMAVFVVLAGILVSFSSISSKNTANKEFEQTITSTNSEVLGDSYIQPSEVPPQPSAGQSGYTANAAKTLIIDKLGVNARIKSLGADERNRIKFPDNIYDIGWYEGSSKPDQEGAVLLNGHIAGATKNGALYGIDMLKRGDVIRIEKGDSKYIAYTVQAVEIFENDEINTTKALSPFVYGKKGLNIITAGGRFNTDTNQYEKRVAVYASQVE